jgi:membrane protein YqaA with SNARE-associated domain
VRTAFLSFLGYFLTPMGLIVMGILDASIFFFLPLGIDFVAIVMTARKPGLFWLYTVLATLGSTVGSGGTYWIGRAIGEKGLPRFVRPRQLERVRARVERGGAVVAALAVIPPPFPFTPFVLGAGALELDLVPFFAALVLARVVRFSVETVLAYRYGSQILHWMETPAFEAVVGGLVVLAVVGSIVSGVFVWRSAKRP